jgi:hypothetical protein
VTTKRARVVVVTHDAALADELSILQPDWEVVVHARIDDVLADVVVVDLDVPQRLPASPFTSTTSRAQSLPCSTPGQPTMTRRWPPTLSSRCCWSAVVTRRPTRKTVPKRSVARPSPPRTTRWSRCRRRPPGVAADVRVRRLDGPPSHRPGPTPRCGRRWAFAVSMLTDFHPFAENLGAVHCIKKYLRRG